MMTCPRCHTAELSEKDRRGVKIDMCPSCRGVWLDRGELEKLIEIAVADHAEDAPAAQAASPMREHRRPDSDDDDRYRRRKHDDDDDDDRYRRKRSSIWDIFD